MVTNNDLSQTYNVFRNNVKHYRKNLKWSQEQLAETADVSASYIKQIESSKEYKNVSLTVILKLSKALDVSVERLFK